MRLLLLVLCTLSASALACGSETPAVCGNGAAEEGEQCDDGNLVDDDLCTNQCAQPGDFEATVVWAPLLRNAAPGFDESCGGVRANDVELKVTGPLNFTLLVSCSNGRIPIRGLVPGTYNVVGTLYRTNIQTDETMAITRGDVQTTIDIVNVNVEVNLDFAFDNFIDSYKGAFFFRVQWATTEVCGAVQNMTVRLERDGVPLSGLDRDENAITFDGLSPVPCRDFSAASPYSFKDIAWGSAQITLGGLDSNQNEVLTGTFDTFVGAGVSNPEMNFDVVPTAGVDAP